MAHYPPNKPGRYLVAPITSAACDAIHVDAPIAQKRTLMGARAWAEHGPHPFGCGILDTQTGLLDVGYGFGVPCPDLAEDTP